MSPGISGRPPAAADTRAAGGGGGGGGERVQSLLEASPAVRGSLGDFVFEEEMPGVLRCSGGFLADPCALELLRFWCYHCQRSSWNAINNGGDNPARRLLRFRRFGLSAVETMNARVAKWDATFREFFCRLISGMFRDVLGWRENIFTSGSFLYTMRTAGHGGAPQQPHKDYMPSFLEGRADSDLPYFAVFPLSASGTFLDIWRPEGGEAQAFFLRRGEALIVRGDVVHAGSASMGKMNVRVHVYASQTEGDLAARATTQWLPYDLYKPKFRRSPLLPRDCCRPDGARKQCAHRPCCFDARSLPDLEATYGKKRG